MWAACDGVDELPGCFQAAVIIPHLSHSPRGPAEPLFYCRRAMLFTHPPTAFQTASLASSHHCTDSRSVVIPRTHRAYYLYDSQESLFRLGRRKRENLLNLCKRNPLTRKSASGIAGNLRTGHSPARLLALPNLSRRSACDRTFVTAQRHTDPSSHKALIVFPLIFIFPESPCI